MDQQDDIAGRKASYDGDVIAWSRDQAALLRAGRWAELDIENLVDEIEDVGRAEERDFTRRVAGLLADLLVWQYQAERRGTNWERIIHGQRRIVVRRLRNMPSLHPILTDPDWIDEAWGDGTQAFRERTGLENEPRHCPWSMAEILTEDWLPPTP